MTVVKYKKFDILRRSTVQFLNIFNNIHINKYDNEGNISQELQVPLKLAGKQKFYYWLYQRTHSKRFPMMAGALKSISPAVSEQGINQKLKFTDKNINDQITTPVPYKLEFELTITTNYIDESNQILEQILPYFTPYCMVTVNLPEINFNFDLKIILNSVNQDWDFEIPEDNYRTQSWLLNFSTVTMLFKPVYESYNVSSINFNWYGYDELLEKTVTTEEGTEVTNFEEIYQIGNYREEDT